MAMSSATTEPSSPMAHCAYSGSGEYFGMLFQLPPCAPDMTVEDERGLLGIVPPQGVEDQAMLGVDSRHTRRTGDRGEGASVLLRRIPETVDHLRQLRHVRSLVAEQVEFPVEPQEVVGIVRLFDLEGEFLHPPDRLGSETGTAFGDGQRFEALADLVDLDVLVAVELRDPGAAVRHQDHQPLTFEAPQGL